MTAMNDKTDTRSKILNTAQDLMLRDGYHGVTVDRIIADAGISKGSFFYHFASKDVLPAALLERFLAQQGEKIRQAFARAETLELEPLAKALYVVDAMVVIFSGEKEQPGCFMAAFSYQLIEEFPKLRDISRDALTGWGQTFGELFEPLCKADRAMADELATHFMALLQGANVIARVEGNCEAIHSAVKHFKLYLTLFHTQA